MVFFVCGDLYRRGLAGGLGGRIKLEWAMIVPDPTCIAWFIDFQMIHGTRPADTCFHIHKKAAST